MDATLQLAEWIIRIPDCRLFMSRCKLNQEGDTIAFPLFGSIHEEGKSPTLV
jgi:hypothetical protein